MADGTGIVSAVAENMSNAGSDLAKGIGQELKDMVSTGTGQLSGNLPQNSLQDPQYQSVAQRDEQEKNQKIERIRKQIQMEYHQELQAMGVPKPPPAPPEEEMPKKKEFESITLPGSKNSRTDLGLTQAQSFTKAETGRNIKG